MRHTRAITPLRHLKSGPSLQTAIKYLAVMSTSHSSSVCDLPSTPYNNVREFRIIVDHNTHTYTMPSVVLGFDGNTPSATAT
jgi:hypothetical protein